MPDSELRSLERIVQADDLFLAALLSGKKEVRRETPCYFFTEMCSGSEAGSCLSLIDFVYLSPLGLRAIQKKRGCLPPNRLPAKRKQLKWLR